VCDLNHAEARLRGIDIDPVRGKDAMHHSVLSHVIA
jgi:hypothetical protein